MTIQTLWESTAPTKGWLESLRSGHPVRLTAGLGFFAQVEPDGSYRTWYEGVGSEPSQRYSVDVAAVVLSRILKGEAPVFTHFDSCLRGGEVVRPDLDATIDALLKLLASSTRKKMEGTIWKPDKGEIRVTGDIWPDAIQPWAYKISIQGRVFEVAGLHDVQAQSRIVIMDGEVIALISTGRGDRYTESVRPLEGGTYYKVSVSWIDPGTEERKPEHWREDA